MKSSLEHKTVRPGRLGDYSYYYSNRMATRPAQSTSKAITAPHVSSKWVVLAVMLAIAVITGPHLLGGSNDTPVASKAPQSSRSSNAPAVAALPTNICSGNTVAQFIKISVSKRHMWVCQGSKQVYDSKVITGMEKYASTETPIGTYKIYAKQADTVLTGADETGSWRDPVSYWMPFLDNQYGTYGFHDATWRNNNEFGNVDPNGDKASHGCVELPLTVSRWLYGWAQVGATVSVEA